MSAVAVATPTAGHEVVRELESRFPNVPFIAQTTVDAMPTLWVPADHLHEVLSYLKSAAPRPFRMLYDLTAIDERLRKHREWPARSRTSPSSTTCSSLERNADIRAEGRAVRRAPVAPLDHPIFGQRELVRARGLGSVRHRVHRPPHLSRHHVAANLGRSSAAQGLPGARHRVRPVSCSMDCAKDDRQEALRFQARRMGDERGNGETTTSCS